MASKIDEMQIYKGVSCKLDADTVFILAYAVHTEEFEDPVTKLTKKNRAKSKYRYIGRVMKISDLNAEVSSMLQDVNRVKNWTWPNMTDFAYVSYDGENTNARGAKWLSMKLKKALTWDEFVAVLNGFNLTKKTTSETAKYVVDNYIASDGSTIEDLRTAKDKLLTLVGKTIVRECELKTLKNKQK